jgi:DNA-binding XRE family transcriptional regulator
MKNTLQTLLFESGMNQIEFANKVGIKVRTLRAQLKNKNTITYSFDYARILNVDTIKGYECGVYVELVIK